MGNCIVTGYEKINKEACNYNCKNCMKSGKMPNLLGRFYIINEKECKCNACGTVYDKNIIYKNVIV